MMDPGSAAPEDESRSAAAARMASWVAAILRGTPTLSTMLGNARVLQAVGTAEAIEVRLVDRSQPAEPLEVARIADPSWFVPEEMPHARRLANRLAAELRRKWELR